MALVGTRVPHFAPRRPPETLNWRMDDARRNLPSVERVLGDLRASLNGDASVQAATDAVRTVIAEARAAGAPAPSSAELAARAHDLLATSAILSLRPVINATGVILQTNLGRAPLSERAIEAMNAVARSYSNLEYDLESGGRGSRNTHLRDLLHRTTGAEDGIVVNNNAAAVFMVLQVFATGREVIVSRGQAVEIGGGFRIPDVLRQSGAVLREVGTTNRTYGRDYADAWGESTAAILRVHSSNFKVVGFTAEALPGELAEIAHRNSGLLLDDLGSGCLPDTTRFGMAHEPTVRESVAGGADLTMFSGDKLLGGPQCGIIVGRAELIEHLRRHPLARALRVDKLTLAALGATLQAYAHGTETVEIPIWRMVSADLNGLKRRAKRWAALARGHGSVVAATSMVGGGSLPGEGVPTWCAAFSMGGADAAAARLRAGSPAIVGRIADGMLLLDPRTVRPAEDRLIEKALVRLLSGNPDRDS